MAVFLHHSEDSSPLVVAVKDKNTVDLGRKILKIHP